MPQSGGDPIPLLKPRLLVGRRENCDITLRFPNVSSHHCELEFTNGYWRVRDLGSSNGVKVNGVRVDEKFLLPGDELAVARHKFKVDYAPAVEGPPPDLDEGEDVFGKSLLERAGMERDRTADGDNDRRSDPDAPLPSLLEKAGLEHKPGKRSKSPRKAPATPAEVEDAALRWLEED